MKEINKYLFDTWQVYIYIENRKYIMDKILNL